MQIETDAFLLGKTNIHSSKTGKDFVKFALVIEGELASFFVPAQAGAKMAQSKPCAELEKTHAPTRCVAVVNLRFTERGVYSDLVGISG